MTPVDEFIQIVKDGGAGVVCTAMMDEDIRTFYRQPWVMVASDGGIGTRHPRGAGTFPRVLGRYVREQQWISLPEAIRKMTSLAASQMKIAERGTLKEGYFADVVVFDPATIADTATFEKPHQYPVGIDTVIVNGIVTVRNGKHTGAHAGRALSGPGYKK